MALLKALQFFSCSGERFSSFLIRSILASLLETICSAVSCGAPAWVSTCGCLAPLPALAAFDLDASDLAASDLEASDLEASDFAVSDFAASDLADPDFAASFVSCFAGGCP